jgi:hypothetical protein
LMSMSQRSVPGEPSASPDSGESEPSLTEPSLTEPQMTPTRQGDDLRSGRLAMSEGAGGPPSSGSMHKRRRRQRPQRGKHRRPPQTRSSHSEGMSRERVFQELEGLLRQIREQAEESADWAEDRLTEITQTVTSFTKSLEEEADPIPERVRAEYQRIREKLSQALKG